MRPRLAALGEGGDMYDNPWLVWPLLKRAIGCALPELQFELGL